MTDPNHIAEARKKVSRPQIREVFLRNGAHIEPGHDDLPDYVYESVFELMELAAPDVQGEPAAWMDDVGNLYPCQSSVDRYLPEGRASIPLYASPQPAEQQPITSSLAYDASIHLTNWLNMNLCECEGGHTCGANEVRRTRDSLLALTEQQPCTHWSHDNPGLADQYRAEALAARRSVGFEQDADDVAPTDIAAAIESLTQPTPDMPSLTGALRQYQHNDGSGLVFGYDKLLVDQYVAGLVDALELARRTLAMAALEGEVTRRIDSALAAHRKQGSEAPVSPAARFPDCEMECGAYGSYCRCADESKEPSHDNQ